MILVVVGLTILVSLLDYYGLTIPVSCSTILDDTSIRLDDTSCCWLDYTTIMARRYSTILVVVGFTIPVSLLDDYGLTIVVSHMLHDTR